MEQRVFSRNDVDKMEIALNEYLIAGWSIKSVVALGNGLLAVVEKPYAMVAEHTHPTLAVN